MERWKRPLIDLYWLIRFWIVIKLMDDSEDVEGSDTTYPHWQGEKGLNCGDWWKLRICPADRFNQAVDGFPRLRFRQPIKKERLFLVSLFSYQAILGEIVDSQDKICLTRTSFHLLMKVFKNSAITSSSVLLTFLTFTFSLLGKNTSRRSLTPSIRP